MKKSLSKCNLLKYFLSGTGLILLCMSTPGVFAGGNHQVSPSMAGSDSIGGLKEYYRNYFPVGVSVSPNSLSGEESVLILKNFVSLSPENVMKSGMIHPQENFYAWDNADKIVDFAQQHGLIMRGHTLCWHKQTPTWLFKDQEGKAVTKEVLLARLKEHISKVVSRYRGKIYGWDVVNEAIDDNDTVFLRESEWYKICGEEFIADAFRWAHEADPKAILFYNDYNTESPVKRDKIFKLLKKLKADGVPIDGIGLQGHWNLTTPTEQALRESIEKFASLGLQVQITELDVSIYGSGDRDPADHQFSAEREQLQINQYKMIFRVLREYKKEITGVTFWNVSDRSSWLDNFPVRGRKNYPLLFDQRLQPKRAFQEVVNF